MHFVPFTQYEGCAMYKYTQAKKITNHNLGRPFHRRIIIFQHNSLLYWRICPNLAQM